VGGDLGAAPGGRARYQVTTPDLRRHLADLIKTEHPFVYCWSCLAAKLRIEEPKLRDTAQMLVVGQRQDFVLARRECACGASDQLLVYTKAGA